ncbi:hypothetical protein ACFE04_012262 [Oxalis oulophora]
MAEKGRIHPDCVNAANPYHECGVACLDKIADQGKGGKDKNKSGTKLLSLKGSLESKSMSPKTLDNGHDVSVAIPRSPALHIHTKKITSSETRRLFEENDNEKRPSLAQLFSYPSLKPMENDAQPIISDSRVLVGKYRVRASVASILQSIFNKYGDISVDCHLESLSMRAYYLESLCSVVQDLQSTPITELTKGKVRDILAVLKDVKSAQIDITWLHSVLSEVSDVIDLLNQCYSLEAARVNCNNVLELTKKELQSHIENFTLKEKAVIQARAQVEETKACINKLELEFFQMDETLTSLKSRVDQYQGKSAAEGLL